MLPEQWGAKAQSIDFFDIKADVSALLALAVDKLNVQFVAAEHPALQPGKRRISFAATRGWDAWQIASTACKSVRYQTRYFSFRTGCDGGTRIGCTVASPVSKFPSIRRDIAVIVDDKISAQELVRAVASVCPEIDFNRQDF